MNKHNCLSKKNIFLHAAITLACIICFYNSLENGLVHDDKFAIERNADVRGETPITDVFFNDFWGKNLQSRKSHKSFRPICTLTFRMNYYLHGLEPYGYHLINVILHVIVSNYLYFILRCEVFKESMQSFLASLLFSTHPVHVEAVTGVVGRADVLSCFLFLLTFHCYTRILQDKTGQLCTMHFVMVLLFGSATLFVKEHSVMIFAVCIMYDIFQNKDTVLRKMFSQTEHNNDEKNKIKIKNEDLFVKRVLILSLWTAGLLQFRLYLMGYSLPTFKEEDNCASFSPQFNTRILSYLHLLAFNAQLLLSPSVLCYDWQIGSIPLVETLSDKRNLHTLLCMSTLLVLSAKLLIRILKAKSQESDKHVIVGLLFLVIPFLPASNFFIRIGFTVAERILYIPSVGFSILVAHGVHKMCTHFRRLSALFYSMFAVMILLFMCKTVQYNKVWYSRETLFRSGVETLPHNAKAHYNYANYLKDENRFNDAIHHYQQAVRLYPVHSSSHNNLGTIFADIDRLKEAEFYFKEAIRHTPGHYNAMLNLAGVFNKKGQLREAEAMLEKCLSLSPNLFDAQRLLAHVLARNKKHVEAEALYEELATKHKDNDLLMFHHAVFLQDTGRFERSISMLTTLLSKEPKNPKYLTSLAKVYKENKQPKVARQLYERAVLYQPKDADLYQNLAVFHFNRGEFEEASKAYERMLVHASPDREHLRNYAIVLFQMQKQKEAVAIVEKLLVENKADLHAHRTLVSFVAELGDNVRTNEVIKQALQHFPEDVQLLLQTANLKRSEKKYEEAIDLYKKVLAKKPRFFEALLNLGTVYHLLKNYDEADVYYKKAYRVDPSNEILKGNMKKLKKLMTN